MSVLLPLMLSFALGGSAAPSSEAAVPRGNDGMIVGLVRRVAEEEPVSDALVIVQCTCIEEPIETHTSASGAFAVHDLPTGHYTVQVLQGKAHVSKVVFLPRRVRLRVNFLIDPKNELKRTIVVPQAIVRRDASAATTVSTEEAQHLAVGGTDRDFTAVVDLAPTATRDSAGISLAGATGAESRYVVEGATITNPAFGTVGVGVVQEFIEQVEVLESGYDAEHGGAAGGQVTARRVSGTNDVRGQVVLRYTPRLARPRFPDQTDEALRVQESGDYQLEGVAVVSGPIVKDRLFFTVGLDPIGQRNSLVQAFHRRVDKDGSSGFEGCPYEPGANDCAEGASHIASKRFAQQIFRTGWFRFGYLGGLDWQVTPRHWLRLSALGAATFRRTSYRLPFSDDPNAFGTNPGTDPSTGESRIATGVVNDHFGTTRSNEVVVSLGYQGRVARDRLEIDANLAYSQLRTLEAWKLDNPELKSLTATQFQDNDGANLYELLDHDESLSLAAGVEESCNSADIPGLACPVRTWVSGGLGEYDDFTQRRAGGRLALTHFFDAVGSHRLKYGTDIEHVAVRQVFRYSGSNLPDFYDNCPSGIGGGEWCYEDGEYAFDFDTRVNNHRFIIVDTDDPNLRRTVGFGRVRVEEGNRRAIATGLGIGARVDGYDATTTTQNYAVFLQDSWAPISQLRLSAGVRWELQDMRDIFGERAALIWDNVGPRASIGYDWTDEGKSRLFASYGWFFQPIPLQLNNRVFGGLVQVRGTYRNEDCQGRSTQIEGLGTFARTVDSQPTEWCVDAHGATSGLTEGSTVPRLRGQFNQQLQLGYEHEVIEDLVIGVRWLHTSLGRAVEDISTNGGLDFIVANPGVPVAASDIAAQRQRCDDLEAQLTELDPGEDERGHVARELNRCLFMVSAFETMNEQFDPPTRNYDAWTLQVHKRFAKSWVLYASYTYSRLFGNYDGFVDPLTGAINIGQSTQYDTPELVRNSFGPLSYDQPHRLKLDGFYQLDLRSAGVLTLGSGVRVSSGYPISMRVQDSHYLGEQLAYLLPRGAGGRIEPHGQWNLSLGYAYPVGRTMQLELIARVFNVTNARAVLRVDEVYSFSGANPIAGGGLEDLKHAKQHDPQSPVGFGQTIVRPQGNYGVPVRFQAPTSAQLELALRF